MSDLVYLVCLGITLVCVPASLLAAVRLYRDPAGRAFWSVWLALSVMAGYLCSLPFGPTREAPWLPWIAAMYFGSVTLAAIFYGIARGGSRQ